MKAVLFLLAAFLLSIPCYGQIKRSPGGIKNPVIWYVTDSATRIPTYISMITSHDSLLSLTHGQAYHSLNFHPCLFFSGNDTLAIPLPDSSMSSSSYFTVYQSGLPEKENSIWHTVKEGQTAIVSTTRRTADLESTAYMNFTDVVPQNAKVGVYIQQKIKETYFPIHQSWRVGYKPTTPSLPIQSFTGLIPEIIAYKRVLSSTERLQVASYLAIKYGITLSDTKATYLNSSGDILWDGLNYTDYHHNIAGIGRDDTSGLAQLKSTSSNAPGLLTVSVGKLDNQKFLLWGDNDKPLSNGTSPAGMPPILQKKWLMAARAGAQPLTTDIVIDTRQIDVPLPSVPVYWMVIDRTGTGDFPADQTEFIRMSSIDDYGNAHFDKVQWGRNGNNREVMGLCVGGELMVATRIIDPHCSEPSSGTLKVKITGGRAPYEIMLAKADGTTVLNRSFATNDTITLSNIGADHYNLTVTDVIRQKYAGSFYVNNADGPKPLALASSYLLPQGQALTIRADSLMSAGITYIWTGHDGFRSDGPDVRISQPGIYHLICTRDGCRYEQEINVSAPLTGRFVLIRSYPNPSNGSYTAMVSLDRPAPVHMAVYTVNGNLIGSADGNGLANYSFSGTIRTVGTYIIKFTSGSYVSSWKQIIVN